MDGSTVAVECTVWFKSNAIILATAFAIDGALVSTSSELPDIWTQNNTKVYQKGQKSFFSSEKMSSDHSEVALSAGSGGGEHCLAVKECERSQTVPDRNWQNGTRLLVKVILRNSLLMNGDIFPQNWIQMALCVCKQRAVVRDPRRSFVVLLLFPEVEYFSKAKKSRNKTFSVTKSVTLLFLVLWHYIAISRGHGSKFIWSCSL